MSPASNRERTAQVAERMRLARQLAGMTQNEAAQALEVTERTYARWERGETQGFMGELDRIAKVFETTSDELLGKAPAAPANGTTSTDTQLEALRSEVAELRALLMDPEALRRAADALAAEGD